jgi:hypothetical protein
MPKLIGIGKRTMVIHTNNICGTDANDRNGRPLPLPGSSEGKEA